MNPALIHDANGCWNGASSPFETTLLQPLPNYAIEQLRLRLLHVLTDTHDLVKSARVLLQMSLETELRVVLVKVMQLTSDVMISNVCGRRRYPEVDADMRQHSYLVAPAVDELKTLPMVPRQYVDLVTRYLGSHYPKYRVSAMATTVCLAAAVTA